MRYFRKQRTRFARFGNSDALMNQRHLYHSAISIIYCKLTWPSNATQAYPRIGLSSHEFQRSVAFAILQ